MMATGTDGIQIKLAEAEAAVDQITAAGTQWQQTFAPYQQFFEALLSDKPWGDDTAGRDFEQKVTGGIKDAAKVGSTIGSVLTTTGPDAKNAIEQFRVNDEDGRRQLSV